MGMMVAHIKIIKNWLILATVAVCDVYCLTVTQYLQQSVFHNGWTTPVELVTF